MNRIINKIKLFPNNNDKSKTIAEMVQKQLIQKGFEIVDDNYDLGIAIGGDGSFLRMVKNTAFNSDIYYIGINAGTLGFLQEIKIDDSILFIDRLNSNQFKIDEIGIQETTIDTDNSSSKFYSLNEIIIRDKNLKTSTLNVKVNDELLEKFNGDGILISTSIGSTAYNLSFGGSIVYSNLHTLQITPIAPLNNRSYRNLLNSVIVPENLKITFIPEKNRKDLLIVVDGENNIYDNVEKIETSVRDKKIKCLRMNNYDYTKTINDKFLK